MMYSPFRIFVLPFVHIRTYSLRVGISTYLIFNQFSWYIAFSSRWTHISSLWDTSLRRLTSIVETLLPYLGSYPLPPDPLLVWFGSLYSNGTSPQLERFVQQVTLFCHNQFMVLLTPFSLLKDRLYLYKHSPVTRLRCTPRFGLSPYLSSTFGPTRFV